MRALIVLPSYNESENIVQLIDALLDANDSYSVCAVDDTSPDGTSDLVATGIRDRARWRDRVHLIRRQTKDGRGGAVRKGFEWGLSQQGQATMDAFAEMDCDFSHEPDAVGQGLGFLQAGNDVAIGARYPDGTIIGWPLHRRLFSWIANGLARRLIDDSVADYTNGFRFYSRGAVQILLQHPQRHTGYIYLSESLSHLLRARMRIASFPIVFRNRERGTSNTSLTEVAHALSGILGIAREHRRPHP